MVDNPKTVIYGGNMYPLASVNGVLQYAEGDAVSFDADPGIPVTADWPFGTPGGMGEYRRISNQSLGYHYGLNTDATTAGVIRVRPAVITSAATNADLTDVPTYIFEDSGYVYIISGRYVQKCSSTGSAITIHRETDLGSGAAGGPPDKWGNGSYAARWFVPAGDSVKFWRLSTVSTETSQAFSPVVTINEGAEFSAADTTLTVNDGTAVSVLDVIIIQSERLLVTAKATNDLTVVRGYAGTTAAAHADTTAVTQATPDTWTQDGTYYALAFAASNAGAVAQINRGYSTNLMDLSTDGTTFPNTVAAGAYEVGSVATAITNIETAATGLLVGKQDNLYEVIDGVSRKLTRYSVADKNANFGAGMLAPEVSNSCYYNHNGLTFYDGESATEVGIDANPLLDRSGTTSSDPFRGTYYETAFGSNRWIYAIYRNNSQDDNGTNWIQAGDRSGGRITWQTLYSPAVNTNLRGAFVDSTKLLWWVDITNNKVKHLQLGANGEPNSVVTNRGETSATQQHYFPHTDFGFPYVLKQFRSVEGMWAGLSATRLGSYAVVVDFVTAVTLTGSAVAAGRHEVFWTTGTNDTGYFLQPRAVFSGTDFATDPKLFSLRVHAYLRPAGARKSNFTIDTSLPYANGAPHLLSPTEMISLWQTADGAAPTSSNFIDPNETTKTIFVPKGGVRVRPGAFIEGVQHWFIDVSAQVWVNA